MLSLLPSETLPRSSSSSLLPLPRSSRLLPASAAARLPDEPWCPLPRCCPEPADPAEPAALALVSKSANVSV